VLVTRPDARPILDLSQYSDAQPLNNALTDRVRNAARMGEERSRFDVWRDPGAVSPVRNVERFGEFNVRALARIESLPSEVRKRSGLS